MRGLSRSLGPALVLGAVTLAIACSPSAAPPATTPQAPAGSATLAPSSAPAAAPAAANTPKYGGQIILGQRDTPENMNVLIGGRAIPVVFNHFYESLVAFDQSVDFRIDYPVIPQLAEKWEMVDDLNWVFTIRNNVKWHDGTPLTAEAVAWGYEHLRDASNPYPGRSNLASVETITVEGNKVRLKLKSPSPALLLGLRAAYIVPKHIFDAGGKDALGAKSVGTGPFSLVSMERTSRTTFKRFPDYWMKDAAGQQQPYLDGIQVVHNMDLTTQQAAMAAGQQDIFLFADKVQLDAFLKSAKDVKVDKYQYASDASFIVNLKRPHLDKPEVRRALHLIIDRHEINESFASGEAMLSLPGVAAMKEGYSLTQADLLKRPGWRQNKQEDLAEARKLLEQAGVPKDWEIKVLNHATFSNAPQGEQAANQLKRFGLKVNYAAVDDGTVLREERAGNYDIALDLVANSDVTIAYNYYHSKGGSNNQFLSDPELDRLTEKLRQTSNKEEQKAATKQLQERILSQNYVLPLVVPTIYAVTQPWVNDFRGGRNIQPDFQGAAAYLWVDTARVPASRK